MQHIITVNIMYDKILIQDHRNTASCYFHKPFKKTASVVVDPAVSQRIGTLLETAGLTHVKTSTHIIPLGHWGGRLGTMAITDIMAIAQAMKQLVVDQTQTALEDFDRLTMQMEQEVEQYRTIFTFHIAYGQRQ